MDPTRDTFIGSSTAFASKPAPTAFGQKPIIMTRQNGAPLLGDINSLVYLCRCRLMKIASKMIPPLITLCT